MDRSRRRSGALIAALAVGLAGAALSPEPPLRAMRWLAPGADPVAVLTMEPAECFAPPAALWDSAVIGRAAFRTPVLLGGQAARAGLSCESCHRGGRSNPDFLFPGISGAPGTADVTSSLFSSHRGDGQDNPVPIPDLSGERARLKVAPDNVEHFIRGLIVEEFDGAEPPPAVLKGLADYVLSLRPDACPSPAWRRVDAARLIEDARRAADAAAAAPDPATQLLMIAGARARLGLIDERFAAPALEGERRALHGADVELAAIAQALRAGRADVRPRLAAWAANTPALAARLARREDRSLFDPNSLRAAAQGRLPAGAS